MATETELRRRIQELQGQIEALGRENARSQAELSRTLDRRLAALREEYRQALTRQKNETDEYYTARIREVQEKLQQEMQRHYRALEREAAQLAAAQAEKIAQLSDCNEELRGVLREMKREQERADVSHRQYALSLSDQLQNVKGRVAAVPHAFFFRGEFGIIDSHTVQIREELAMKMYQAAAADAGSVIMEFDLLGAKVEQALREWTLAFQDYAGTVKHIAERIRALEAQPLETAAGRFVMAPQELDFWSSGAYLPFREKIEAALSVRLSARARVRRAGRNLRPGHAGPTVERRADGRHDLHPLRADALRRALGPGGQPLRHADGRRLQRQEKALPRARRGAVGAALVSEDAQAESPGLL